MSVCLIMTKNRAYERFLIIHISGINDSLANYTKLLLSSLNWKHGLSLCIIKIVGPSTFDLFFKKALLCIQCMIQTRYACSDSKIGDSPHPHERGTNLQYEPFSFYFRTMSRVQKSPYSLKVGLHWRKISRRLEFVRIWKYSVFALVNNMKK